MQHETYNLHIHGHKSDHPFNRADERRRRKKETGWWPVHNREAFENRSLKTKDHQKRVSKAGLEFLHLRYWIRRVQLEWQTAKYLRGDNHGVYFFYGGVVVKRREEVWGRKGGGNRRGEEAERTKGKWRRW